MTTDSSNALVSPSDVADLAGVNRPVVSNWRKRHTDFPPAVAGTEAKPLFARDAVVDWLRRHGRRVESDNAGARIWSALNVLRDRVPLEDAADLVLLLATLRRWDPSEFNTILRADPADQHAQIESAMNKIRQHQDFEHLRQPSQALLALQPNACVIVDALAQTADAELADAVDFVLERASRWQIKGGAELGFIGSRTSALLASLAVGSHGTVYDPACGIGNVLLRIAGHGNATRLVGSDVNVDAVQIARQRTFLHDAAVELVVADVLTADPHPQLRADVVVAEPPFGMSWDPTSKLADPRFVFGLAPRMASDLAWVQHAIAHLAPGGRGYVLTAPGALFRSGTERQIRANLLSAACVKAIVALPAKMLPHTSIAPALWVVGPRADGQSDVLLVDASHVEDAEHRVSGWLGHDDIVRGEIEAPHAAVPVTELLAADAVLTPVKWVGDFALDEKAIAASFSRASKAVERTVRAICESPLTFQNVARLSKPRVVTVGELIDNRVVQMRSGRPDRARELDEDAEVRIVRASDVKSRSLPPIKDAAHLVHRDLTEEDDVLVTTMNEVRAVVDETGGHLPSTGVDRLRIVDRSVISPDYLAAVITGSWNARLQAGTSIQRAPIRDLEVPLVSTDEQAKVVIAHAIVGQIQEQARQLDTQAGELQRAILDALRYNVPLDSASSVEDHRQNVYDDEKDNN